MGYIKGILGAGEKISNAPGYHWVIYLKCIICGGVGVLFIASGESFSVSVGGVFLVLCSVFFVRAWSSEVAITTQRLVSKRGWIARKTEELALSRVEEINFRQSILGRILGYGVVVVNGVGGNSIKLKYVSRPLYFKKVLDELSKSLQKSKH